MNWFIMPPSFFDIENSFETGSNLVPGVLVGHSPFQKKQLLWKIIYLLVDFIYSAASSFLPLRL